MDKQSLYAAFKQAVVEQINQHGSVSPITAIAPDTGKKYVIYDDHLIPFDVADSLILDAVDEVLQ